MLQRPQSMSRLACSITKGLRHQDAEHLDHREGHQRGAACLTSQEAGSRKIKGRLGTRCSPQKHGFISHWVSDPDFPLC